MTRVLLLSALLPVGAALYLVVTVLIGRGLKRTRRRMEREVVDEIFKR